MTEMPIKKIIARRVTIEEGDLVLDGSTEESRISLSSIRRFGVMKRYSRVLVVLTIVIAVISIYTQDLFHTILTLVALGVTLATREEVLVLETANGSILEISTRDRKSIKKAAEGLSKLLTH